MFAQHHSGFSRNGSKRCRGVQAVVSWAIAVFFLLNFISFLQQESQIRPKDVMAVVDITPTSISSNTSQVEELHDEAQTLSTDGTSAEAPSIVNTDDCVSADVECIRNFIARINRDQTVKNTAQFELSSDDSAVVIVVQVHNRTEYLRHLVNSLRRVEGISNALLIFSHDYYSREINEIVAAIDFCLTMQIFYPYPMQVYSNEFPGPDARDCPQNIGKEKAEIMQCGNAKYPDKYGHYRTAAITQPKHHWFWKINQIFDHLSVMKHFPGPVLLLEEDQYISPDALLVLRQMFRLRSKVCRDCSIVSLGVHDKNSQFGILSDKVEVMHWASNKNNMGMALDRNVWEKIKKCADAFCNYDDYNWDWSLHLVGIVCFPSRLKVLSVKSPRVFHIGQWLFVCSGLHTKGKDCDPKATVGAIETLLINSKASLFPKSLSVFAFSSKPLPPPKPNGGWADPRDMKLCLGFTNSSSHR